MRRNEEERSNLFSRRALLIGTAQGALLSVLVARMYYLQVVNAKSYDLQSEDNRIKVEYDPPIRGLIYDRQGVTLAENVEFYSLNFVAAFAKDRNLVFGHLNRLIGFTIKEIETAQLRLRQTRSYVPIQLRAELTWEEVAKVEANKPDLPGVEIGVSYRRKYPIAEPMAHVIGYVGKATKKDVQKQRDPVLLLPGFRMGKLGVEKSFESALRGNAGKRLIETNAVGRTIQVLSEDESEHGLRIDLTIDSALQTKIHKMLSKERSASAVVMEIETGAVRALVSSPSYDQNKFITGFSREEWDKLRKDDRAPFRNKALAGTYAPGSTFKMIVALAALGEGLSPKELIRCTGKVTVGKDNQIFHCWNKSGHGPMNLANSLIRSCDVYYYELAQRIGINKIADVARKFGFGQKQMLDMVDENAGNMPDPEWKRAKRNRAWLPGDTLNTSIGQGSILSTPLQLAAMTCTLVNGGYRVQPHIFKQEVPLPKQSIGIPQKHLDLVFEAMVGVTRDRRGTAHEARIEDEALEMGGKTGTTQVRSITLSERSEGVVSNEDLEWNLRDHALFVGFAPVVKPKFAVSVIVEHGGSGGKTAAPIASEILLETQLQDLALEQQNTTVASVKG